VVPSARVEAMRVAQKAHRTGDVFETYPYDDQGLKWTNDRGYERRREAQRDE